MRYFAQLTKPKLILWCYLVWYLTIASWYFDPSPRLWLSSLGIAALIGFALNLATATPSGDPTSAQAAKKDHWITFRLYLFPLCVSSYAALIKGKDFFLLFPTEPSPLISAITACAIFLGLVATIKLTQHRR